MPSPTASITGTLTNGATWAVGRYANALGLDGVNNYVNLGNPPALQITGSMTISAWINARSFPVDDAAIVGFVADKTRQTLDDFMMWEAIGVRNLG